MLKIKIKASGIANLTDARYFAAREVEWLGFRLGDGTDGTLSLSAVKAIAEWVDGVKIIGEFDFAPAAEILAASEQLRFDAVQVGMFTPAFEMEKLAGLTVIKEVVVEKNASDSTLAAYLNEYASYCDYFLLDFSKSGIQWDDVKLGKPIALDTLEEMMRSHKIILALDFDAALAAEVLERLHPSALSLSGGAEEKVGLKSFEQLDAILDQLEMTV